MTSSESPMRVLVIDDEMDIRDGCERILTRMGLEVDKAEGGEQGLELLSRRAVNVVLLDLKMPGIGGIKLLPRIREQYPEVMVIVITGFATLETAVEAMKRGAYDFIPKPFQPDQLRITVKRALERIRLAREAKALELERRRTLRDLHNEQSRTRSIIRALPFGVMATDTECNVVLMNPAFRAMVGLEPGVPPGEHLSSYVDDQGLCGLVAAIGRDGAEPDDDHSLEIIVDDHTHLLAQGTRIDSRTGDYLGAVLVFMDVTPFRELEALRSDFVAKVSHDLRSPLSTIYLQLSLLLGDGAEEGDPKSRQILERAKARTQGLISFVRDVMEISRIENQAGREKLAEVSLAEVLAGAVEGHNTQAENKKLSLKLVLPADELPPITGDQTSLESVFNNLISNAVNYTPEGGDITVSAALAGDCIAVEVSDNGLGIPEEKLDVIFDKFYRVKNEKTRYITGTGLGLPIVKSVVDAMGGKIEVQSKIDEGATFRVVLPLEPQ